MDPLQKRKQDLQEQLVEEYSLLRKLEEELRLEDEPVRKTRLERNINDVNDRINKHKAELQSLIIELQNNPLDLPEELVDKPFIDNPSEVLEDSPDLENMPDIPVDLLSSAIKYHNEIKNKQSQLSNISNWFNVGNGVGRDQCTYATKILKSVREVVQSFSELLEGTTAPEFRVDSVQFCYSLITPLHASAKLLNDLARLMPAFGNSQRLSRDSLMWQEEVCKDLNGLQEGLREINIHMTLYETLLDVYDLSKLKLLYLKMGINYKDFSADSREMKISKLIEYCKRNNNYYTELIREVQVEDPNRLSK